MTLKVVRCPENPIVRPGLYEWRMAVTFNPAVIYDEGKFYMYERAAGGLRPFHCYIGMLESEDGIHFKHTLPEPVITPEMCGSKYGSVQDPRIVRIDETYYITFAFRPYAWCSNPTGVGVPESYQVEFPGFSGKDEDNQTRSGVAASKDRIHWTIVGWVNPPPADDRNVILFPEKINGRFAVLRRPSAFVGTDTKHTDEQPCIRISFSDDLKSWSEPQVVIRPQYKWEDNRIGGSTPPIRTKDGWLVFYHGVQSIYPPTRRVVYRMSAMLLDLKDPTKVLARCPEPIMEPQEYYEKFGLYIPNVIFPTAAVVKDGLVHIYYGVCDTAIALATISLDDLLRHILDYRHHLL
jgi:predicted GH43/DUF377 family glycosyl hydrolase